MSDIRELKILVDKEVVDTIKMRLFQLGLCSLIDGEYIPKSKLISDFIDLNILGASKGNQHNNYRDVVSECFADKQNTKEPEMYRVFKKFSVDYSPKTVYNIIQSYLYKIYGEFE